MATTRHRSANIAAPKEEGLPSALEIGETSQKAWGKLKSPIVGITDGEFQTATREAFRQHSIEAAYYLRRMGVRLPRELTKDFQEVADREGRDDKISFPSIKIETMAGLARAGADISRGMRRFGKGLRDHLMKIGGQTLFLADFPIQAMMARDDLGLDKDGKVGTLVRQADEHILQDLEVWVVYRHSYSQAATSLAAMKSFGMDVSAPLKKWGKKMNASLDDDIKKAEKGGRYSSESGLLAIEMMWGLSELGLRERAKKTA